MNHLDKNQHGFRSRRSCERQLLHTTDDISKFLNSGMQVDMGISAVKYGVLQGTVFCPTLYLIYSNDIADNLDSTVIQGFPGSFQSIVLVIESLKV